MTSVASQTPNRDQIASFYDEFKQLGLRDFVYSNPRVEAAIRLVSSCVTSETRTLLDIGCGIGISTQQLHRRHPRVSLQGLDISPRCIEVARQLFGGPGIEFANHDLNTAPPGGPYDVVALLDVYEHVPRAQWPRLNQVLGESLSPRGILVLTTPSPLTQESLAQHDPGGLQVVDETVHCEDIVRLAQAVGGTMTLYRLASIWHTNDYLHAVIERAPRRVPVFERWSRPRIWAHILRRKCNFLGVIRRRRLVRSKLGVRV
jgi:trans-aconitate methyltransferase